MRRRLIRIAASALAAVMVALLARTTYAGPASAAAVRPTAERVPHSRPVPVLMYHVIGPRPAGAPFPELYVSRADFAGQLTWLASNGYRPVTLRNVFDYWHGRRSLPRKPIVLTFDDGDRSHFTIAGPLLRARKWPGVLNLELAHLVHGDLTQRMVMRLLTDGWELASHTLTHPDLTAVDANRLKREVGRSRFLLQRRFGADVDFFCYPSGRYDGRVIAAVRAADYLGATTTQHGLARRTSPFTMSRIRIDGSDGVRGLAEKLASARERVKA